MVLLWASSHNHLSGLHTSASSPNVALSLWAAQGWIPIAVPPSRRFPQIVAPSGGTTLSNGNPKGGWIRPPSLMQASRNGRSRASFQVIGLEIRFSFIAVLISSRSRAKLLGCLKRLYSIERMTIAVVSLPAVIFEVVQAMTALQGDTFKQGLYNGSGVHTSLGLRGPLS